MALEFCLAELSQLDKPIVISRLATLADLSSAEVAKTFGPTWVRIGVERRREVIWRLVNLAEENAELNFDNVFQACLKDFDPLVRAKSIEGLKECKDCRLITTLIDLVENDNEEAVRIKATTALGRFTLLIELNKLPQRHLDRIAQALFSVIESEGESIELRCQAVEAAAPFNLPQVKATIYQAYLSDNSKMKTSAIRAMGKNGDIQWLPILLKELKNPNPSIALEAIESCGELGEAVAIPHLVQLIQDTNGQIQSAAIKAIAEIGEEDAQEVLLKFHSHSNRIGRETAGGVWDDELD